MRDIWHLLQIRYVLNLESSAVDDDDVLFSRRKIRINASLLMAIHNDLWAKNDFVKLDLIGIQLSYYQTRACDIYQARSKNKGKLANQIEHILKLQQQQLIF